MKQIKVIIGMLGMDQHEVGAIAVSKMLRDAGYEVVYLGRFNLPVDILRTALEEDVQLIGLSCHSWEYQHYVPELLRLLQESDLAIPVIVGGSVITAKDKVALEEMGVAAAFGAGATEEEIVTTVQQVGSRALQELEMSSES